jgi:hypothetical protein
MYTNADSQACESAMIPKDMELSELFRELANIWKAETGILSDITKKSMNWSYQQIIGLGLPVVPLILQELKVKPADWYWALSAITRQDPIKPEHAGNMAAMAQDWIRWGKDRGLA